MREKGALTPILTIALLLFAFGFIAQAVAEQRTLPFDRLIFLALRDKTHPSEPWGPAWFQEAARDVTGAIRTAFATVAGQGATKPVILTQPDIRRFVRKLVEPEMPDVWVASFAELLPEVTLKPVARAAPGA